MLEQNDPERALIIAIIAQAVIDCQRPKPSLLVKSGKRRRHWAKAKQDWLNCRTSALEWLLAESEPLPRLLSAQWCCQALGWNYRKHRQMWALKLRGYTIA